MIQLVKTAENKGRASKSPSIIHVSFSINNEPLKATNQILSFLIAKMCHQPYLWMDAHAVPCTACVGVYGACTLEAHAGCRPRLKQETAVLWLLAHSDRSGRIHIWYAPGHLGNALKKKKNPPVPLEEIWSALLLVWRFSVPRINASLRLRARVVPGRRKTRRYYGNSGVLSCSSCEERSLCLCHTLTWPSCWREAPSQCDVHLKSASFHQEQTPLMFFERNTTFTGDF